MKAHLKITPEPWQFYGQVVVLCETLAKNPQPVLGWFSDEMKVRESVADFRGLCRECRKLYMTREPDMRKEWVYAITQKESER